MTDDQARWNKRYSAHDTHTSAPAQFLKEQEELLLQVAQGHALDIACGRGQNSFYLASLGLEVDAVDLSNVAIEHVQQEASRTGATVNPIQLNLETEPFPAAEYQVIICFNYLQRSLFPKIQQALAPDGLLIYETYHRDHIDRLENAIRREYVFEDNELLDAFSELRVLAYREEVVDLKDGIHKKAIASIVAKKTD